MKCKYCGEEGLSWYQEGTRWRLGIKVDENDYRPHTCKPVTQKRVKANNELSCAAYCHEHQMPCVFCDDPKCMYCTPKPSFCLQCNSHARVIDVR